MVGKTRGSRLDSALHRGDTSRMRRFESHFHWGTFSAQEKKSLGRSEMISETLWVQTCGVVLMLHKCRDTLILSVLSCPASAHPPPAHRQAENTLVACDKPIMGWCRSPSGEAAQTRQC